jgi:two-component system cell cycle sensor histidine kinase/response regulator CckA
MLQTNRSRKQVLEQIEDLRGRLAELEAQLARMEALSADDPGIPANDSPCDSNPSIPPDSPLPGLEPRPLQDQHSGGSAMPLTQGALRLREASFQPLADILPVMVWITDAEGQCTYINQRWLDFTGQSEGQALGMGWLQCVHPEDAEQSARIFLKANRNRQSFTLDYRVRRRDGSYRWAIDVGQPHFDGAGKFLGYVGVVLDITERKQAEQGLAEGQRRMQALFDNALDGILLTDDEGRYVDANPAACALLGYSREELLKLTTWDVTEPGYFDAAREHWRKFLAAGWNAGEYRVLRKDGNVREFEFRAVANVLPGLHLSSSRDVTERRRIEQSLRQSEARLKEAQRIAGLGNWEVDWASKAVFWSEEMYRLCGVTSERFTPTIDSFLALVPSEDRQRLLNEVDAAIAERRPYALDHRLARPDGTTLVVSEQAEIIFDASGRAVRFVGTMLDITARKHAEDELRALNAVLENAVEGISRLNRDGVYVAANGAYARMVGYAPEELPGMSWEPTVAADDRPRVVAAYERMLAEGRAESEARGVRKDGSVFWKQLVMVRALDATGDGIGHYCFMKDITDQKRLEEQLLQSQKQEAIGRLAGGVAHDFNNLLTVINGYSELLLSSPRSDEFSRRLAGEIKKAGDRAASLTQQLLAFSRKAIIQPVVLDLNAVVADAESMLRRLIGEDILLVTRLEANLGSVKMDRGQLDQVILNLAVNARDAMPNGGTLTLETRNMTLNPSAGARMEVIPGPYVVLEVVDTGCGMDEFVKGQLFEPFFTTKEVGKGTGLGLATVYGIVKQSAGNIDVESAPGQGTVFRISLPCISEVTESQAAELPVVALPGGRETVLLVEDDDGVRALAQLVLQSAGYRVLEACDGPAAIQLCGRHSGPIAILVTDVVMPQMSGKQLADRLRPLQAEMKVLYVSGYTDDALGRHGVLDNGLAFLQKPYTPMTLASKVREVLDRRA